MIYLIIEQKDPNFYWTENLTRILGYQDSFGRAEDVVYKLEQEPHGSHISYQILEVPIIPCS